MIADVMTTVATTVLLCLASFGILFVLLAALLAGRYRAPVLPAETPAPAVTILKPLHGAEPALAANLASVFAQDYPGAVQIIAGVGDADDPALACFADVAARYPMVAARAIVDARRHGPNNKLSNLSNMAEAIEHPLVVIADSDVAWPVDTLRRLAAALAEPGVGLVTCLHVGRGDAGFWSRLAAMDLSYRYMPMVIAGSALGLARPALGPTMAMRRETLEAIGGFARFTSVLADDYEIGRAVRALGHRVVLPPLFVTHGCAEASLAALVTHELRWSLTIARIGLAGFVGSATVHAVPLALAATLVAGFDALPLAVLAAAIGARALLKWRIDRVAGTVSGPQWLLPLRDLLSAGVFFATFMVNKVDWRGAQFRVTRDGKLHSTHQSTQGSVS